MSRQLRYKGAVSDILVNGVWLASEAAGGDRRYADSQAFSSSAIGHSDMTHIDYYSLSIYLADIRRSATI
ncbi:MAG TPA: hypothetical protein VN695_15480 [Streptosporangiaceae bacterium]|nr:hypothetical protein [Streptosporangiaceae bacterium]